METILSMLEYTQKELNNAEKELINNIRNGKEKDVLCWRAKIKTHQNFITYLIDISSQNSQEELMRYIEMLEKDRDMYKTLYEQTTKMVEDIQKEKKHLSDILNAKRVLDSFKYIKK